MNVLNRRGFLWAGASVSAAAVWPGSARAAEAAPVPAVTRQLAQFLVGARYEDLPENVKREGRRTYKGPS